MKLNHIDCHVTVMDRDANVEGGVPLPEYLTSYGNGHVSSFISIPTHPPSFRIQVKSDRFIAHTLVAQVFIDGVYQCNRAQAIRKSVDGARGKLDISLINFQRMKTQGLVRMPQRGCREFGLKPWPCDRIDTSMSLPATSTAGQAS